MCQAVDRVLGASGRIRLSPGLRLLHFCGRHRPVNNCWRKRWDKSERAFLKEVLME